MLNLYLESLDELCFFLSGEMHWILRLSASVYKYIYNTVLGRPGIGHDLFSLLEDLKHVSMFTSTIESQCLKKLYSLTLHLIFEYHLHFKIYPLPTT